MQLAMVYKHSPVLTLGTGTEYPQELLSTRVPGR